MHDSTITPATNGGEKKRKQENNDKLNYDRTCFFNPFADSSTL